MKLKRLLNSIPFRVAVAVLATGIVVFGIAALGSGGDPDRWVAQLTDPTPPADGGAVLRTVGGISPERVTATPTPPPTAGDQGPDGVQGDGGEPVSPGSPEAPGQPDPDPAVSTVRVILWNDTQDSRLLGTEVILGQSNWRPKDSTDASQTGSLTLIPVGDLLTLQVYPDGRQGNRIDVEVKLTADMIDNSEEDAIHVAISDSKVRVLGTPIVDFDVDFDR